MLVEVYFDDFKVTQTKSPVIQTDDYYPFGLTFNSYQRENSIKNQYLYNKGTERQDELDINIDLTKFRGYDPTIGRWWQIDPKADKEGQEVWSPYNYAFNNSIRYNDPDGDCIPCLAAQLSVKYAALVGSFSSSSSRSAVARVATNSSSTVQSRVSSDSPVTAIDNKGMARIGDAKIVADVASKNSKTLANEVSKDGLSAAKAIGTGVEIAGAGTPVSAIGAGINFLASSFDEARQVTFEGKSGADAMTNVGVDGTITLATGGLAGAAKSTIGAKEVGKGVFDKVIDLHSIVYSNLVQWAVGQMTENQSTQKDKKK